MSDKHESTSTLAAGLPVLVQVASMLLAAVPIALGKVQSVRLQDWTGAEVVLPSERHSVVELGGPSGSLTVTIGGVPLVELQRLDGASLSYDLSIELDGGLRKTFKAIKVASLAAPTIKPELVRLAQAAVQAGLLPPAIQDIFSGACRWHPADRIGPHALDELVQGPGGLLLKGWISAIGRRNVTIFSEDLSSACTSDVMLLHERPDVQQHLAPLHVSGGDTELHGFIAVLPTCGNPIGNIFVFERAADHQLMYGPIAVAPRNSPLDAIALILDEFDRQPIGTEPAVVPMMLRPFMPKTLRNGVPRSTEHGPRESPRVSIVVPLSGDPIFVISLLSQQERWRSAVGAAFQWVFVTTRLADYARISRILSLREAALSAQATLVLAESPHSVGLALNRGARAALAERLCFLDESSWLLSSEPLLDGLAALDMKSASAIALAAEWEDGHPDTGEIAPMPRHQLPPFCMETAAGQLSGSTNHDWRGLVVRKVDWNAIGGFSEVLTSPELVGLEFSRRLSCQSRDFKIVHRPSIGRSAAERQQRDRPLLVQRATALLDWCEVHASKICPPRPNQGISS